MNTPRIMLNNRKRFLFSAALAAVLLLLAGGANALAATNTVRCVPKTSISTVCTSGAGESYIQDAVSNAKSGDVILVGPGYYNEWVYVNVSNLCIFGAQAGKDARNRHESGKESIVDASPGAYGYANGAAFYIEGDNVVIDGFTIQGGNEDAGDNGSGIYVDATEPVQILNNIIQNNAIGLYLYDTQYALVEYNLFQNNNNGNAGWDVSNFDGQSGIGIGEYEGGSGITITKNAFEGNLGAAMWLLNAGNSEISKNTSEKDGSFLGSSYCDSIYFEHNQGKDFGAQGVQQVWGTAADAAIDVTYYNYGLQINDNVLDKGRVAGYNGIAFSTIFGVYTGEYVCEYCQVSDNTVTHFAANGIVAEPYGSDATLEYSMISHNDVEDNGKDGILIGNAPHNYYNAVSDNKAEGNGRNDCADDTANDFTAGTYNTWFNNIGTYSYPEGLCAQSGWWH
jgi:parallel beta-helix repeat protein